MAVSFAQNLAQSFKYDAIKGQVSSKATLVLTIPATKIGSLSIISSLMVLYSFDEYYNSAVVTSLFLTTYDSGVPFTPQNVRIYSSTPSNVFDPFLLHNFGVLT